MLLFKFFYSAIDDLLFKKISQGQKVKLVTSRMAVGYLFSNIWKVKMGQKLPW